MDDAYFHHIRHDIAPLLPTTATRILDVGAGAGGTTSWLKTKYPGSFTVAFEGNAALAGELSQNVDEPHIVDLNGPLPDIGRPDLILCLDVLEHLVRPDEVLRRLTSAMADSATVIVSLPNIAHASVSFPLAFGGRFDYRDAGILDRTHLRFFVRKSAIACMNEAGLTVRRGIRLGFHGPRTRLLDLLTGGRARDVLTKQYVLAGTRANTGAVQGEVEWLLG